MHLRNNLTITTLISFLSLSVLQFGFHMYFYHLGRDTLKVDNTLNLIIGILVIIIQTLSICSFYKNPFNDQQMGLYRTLKDYHNEKVKPSRL
jgi:heme/copper-type cytochrome/quinol oxidase subunit 4